MNTSQLQCIFSCDPVFRHRTLGVFAADQLPRHLPTYPCAFIVNTDDSHKPGQHWLAFFVQNNSLECFDSYGQFPGSYNSNFTFWIERHFKTMRINNQRLQSDWTNVCGLYCIYFLHHRLLGESMDSIVFPFSTTDLKANDIYILTYFRGCILIA